MLTHDQLRRSLFPLGGHTKDIVRLEADERDLQVANKPDSYDICFVADGDNAGWLSEKIGPQPGAIVDESGEKIGDHEGAYAFTIGQRKGLRLGVPAADGKPRFVVDIEPVSGTVTVGPQAHVEVTSLGCTRPLWSAAAPSEILGCTAELRALGDDHPANAPHTERAVES